MTKGVDASHWNPPLHYPAIKEAGYEFAFVKCSEPSNYMPPAGVDGDYLEHVTGAEEAGLLWSPYHFWRDWGTGGAEGQIDAYLQNVFGRGNPTCRYVILDIEDKYAPKLTLETRRRIGRSVAYLDDKLPAGFEVLLYSAQWWWDAWVANDDVILESGRRVVFTHYPLWCADYGRPPGNPRLPTGAWTSAAIHQYTDRENIPESGDPTIDANYTALTREQLAVGLPTPTIEERLADLETRVTALEEG